MQLFDSNHSAFPNLPFEVPVLSLFGQKNTHPEREIMPWMDMNTIVDIVTDRMIEVIRKDLSFVAPADSVKPKKTTKKAKKATRV